MQICTWNFLKPLFPCAKMHINWTEIKYNLFNKDRHITAQFTIVNYYVKLFWLFMVSCWYHYYLNFFCYHIHTRGGVCFNHQISTSIYTLYPYKNTALFYMLTLNPLVCLWFLSRFRVYILWLTVYGLIG